MSTVFFGFVFDLALDPTNKTNSKHFIAPIPSQEKRYLITGYCTVSADLVVLDYFELDAWCGFATMLKTVQRRLYGRGCDVAFVDPSYTGSDVKDKVIGSDAIAHVLRSRSANTCA